MTNLLPDFQKYLIENKLAPEGQVSFYALWASRFLSFSNRHQDKAIELRKKLFLDSLTKEQKLQDWQVNQMGKCTSPFPAARRFLASS